MVHFWETQILAKSSGCLNAKVKLGTTGETKIYNRNVAGGGIMVFLSCFIFNQGQTLL